MGEILNIMVGITNMRKTMPSTKEIDVQKVRRIKGTILMELGKLISPFISKIMLTNVS